jgi:hypothetical protein
MMPYRKGKGRKEDLDSFWNLGGLFVVPEPELRAGSSDASRTRRAVSACYGAPYAVISQVVRVNF